MNLPPVVRRFRNQVTDAVHGMHARQNPLIRIIAVIDNRPDRFHRQGFHQFQILAESATEPIIMMDMFHEYK